MERKHLYINDQDLADFNIYITSSSVRNAPQIDYEVLEVQGRSGDIIRHNDRFANIEIVYECFCNENIIENLQKLKTLIYTNVGYLKIQSDYDPEYYREGYFDGQLEIDPFYNESQIQFILTFNCKPQKTKIESEESWYNYEVSTMNFWEFASKDNQIIANALSRLPIANRPSEKVYQIETFILSNDQTTKTGTLTANGGDGKGDLFFVIETKASNTTNTALESMQFVKLLGYGFVNDSGNLSISYTLQNQPSTMTVNQFVLLVRPYYDYQLANGYDVTCKVGTQTMNDSNVFAETNNSIVLTNKNILPYNPLLTLYFYNPETYSRLWNKYIRFNNKMAIVNFEKMNDDGIYSEVVKKSYETVYGINKWNKKYFMDHMQNITIDGITFTNCLTDSADFTLDGTISNKYFNFGLVGQRNENNVSFLTTGKYKVDIKVEDVQGLEETTLTFSVSIRSANTIFPYSNQLIRFEEYAPGQFLAHLDINIPSELYGTEFHYEEENGDFIYLSLDFENDAKTLQFEDSSVYFQVREYNTDFNDFEAYFTAKAFYFFLNCETFDMYAMSSDNNRVSLNNYVEFMDKMSLPYGDNTVQVSEHNSYPEFVEMKTTCKGQTL